LTQYNLPTLALFLQDYDLKFQFVILLEKTTEAYKDAENLSKDMKELFNLISKRLGNIPIKIYSIDSIKNPKIVEIDKKRFLKDVDFRQIIRDMEIEY
jgi:hypothetical protein